MSAGWQQEGGYSLVGEAVTEAGDDAITRLLNDLPAFAMGYFGSKFPAPIDGLVPLHWEDGTEQFAKAVKQAFGIGDEKDAEAGAAGGSTGGGSGGVGQQQAKEVGGVGQQAAEQQLSISQLLMAQGAKKAGAVAVNCVSKEEFAAVCNHTACGKRSEPGQPFSTCARCGAGYCSRECQKEDWRRHKVGCCPEKLRYHVPAELDTINSIKRLAVSRMAEELMAELSVAAVAFHERLGRGMLVVTMEDFIYVMSPDAKQKCHLYMMWFPEADIPSRVPLVPGVKEHGKELFRKCKEPLVPVLFQDHQYGLGMGLPLLFQRDNCLQALRQGSTELREMDVLCLDTVSNEAAFIDFHNMAAVVADVGMGGR